MKLVVDENIVQGKEAFSSFGEVLFLNGRKISNQILLDADVLIVRSITDVDENILKNTNVKFVGTATIGTDHIDLNYLKENNIQFSSAAGCNSYSVAEYVFSALTHFANKYNFRLSEKSIGVIGYGNIGTKVVKIANALGMKVVINDPPLERNRDENIFSSLDKALKCDIVTFHVPLNMDGVDKTFHMLNEKNIELIKNDSILINSCRGPVVNNQVLAKKLKERNNILTVLDVWEGEPNYDSELFSLIEIGTPHIAGYSLEGKVNGTKIIYDALSHHLKTPSSWNPFLEEVVDNKLEIFENESDPQILKKLFDKSYKIMEDDTLLRNGAEFVEEEKRKHFDSLRKGYKERRELNNFEVISKPDSGKLKNLLHVLRIN